MHAPCVRWALGGRRRKRRRRRRREEGGGGRREEESLFISSAVVVGGGQSIKTQQVTEILVGSMYLCFYVNDIKSTGSRGRTWVLIRCNTWERLCIPFALTLTLEAWQSYLKAGALRQL